MKICQNYKNTPQSFGLLNKKAKNVITVNSNLRVDVCMPEINAL